METGSCEYRISANEAGPDDDTRAKSKHATGAAGRRPAFKTRPWEASSAGLFDDDDRRRRISGKRTARAEDDNAVTATCSSDESAVEMAER